MCDFNRKSIEVTVSTASSQKKRFPGKSYFLAVTLFIFSFIPSVVQGATPLKAGDRVVIYGDSITEQRLYSLYMHMSANNVSVDNSALFHGI